MGKIAMMVLFAIMHVIVVARANEPSSPFSSASSLATSLHSPSSVDDSAISEIIKNKRFRMCQPITGISCSALTDFPPVFLECLSVNTTFCAEIFLRAIHDCTLDCTANSMRTSTEYGTRYCLLLQTHMHDENIELKM